MAQMSSRDHLAAAAPQLIAIVDAGHRRPRRYAEQARGNPLLVPEEVDLGAPFMLHPSREPASYAGSGLDFLPV